MTDIEITEFAFTFGTQYRRPSEFNHPDENHPRGMHGNGYAVIEAPDMGTAREIAHAIFGDKWAFPYTLEEILSDPRRQQFYPDGEILRIAWQTPEQKRAILAQMESIVEGHPGAGPVTVEPTFTPPDMPSDLYNALMTYLLERTAGDRAAIILADQVKNLYGSSARRSQARDPLYETAQGERTEFAKGRDKRLDELAEHNERIRQRFADMGSPRAIRDAPDKDGSPIDIHSEQSELSHRPSAAELLAEREEPFLWDGKGSTHILAIHAHVHDANSPGTCLKNRFGPLCTPLVQSEVPETGDFRDGTEAEDTGGY